MGNVSPGDKTRPGVDSRSGQKNDEEENMEFRKKEFSKSRFSDPVSLDNTKDYLCIS